MIFAHRHTSGAALIVGAGFVVCVQRGICERYSLTALLAHLGKEASEADQRAAMRAHKRAVVGGAFIHETPLELSVMLQSGQMSNQTHSGLVIHQPTP